MKILTNVVGVVLILLGALWALQGIGILGGSMMSGQSQWLVIGVIVIAVGIGVLYWANIPRAPRRG